MERPKQRSKIRSLLGQLFYRVKKNLYWHFSAVNFAKQSQNQLPYLLFEHRTPLRRELKNVDNWMQENKIQNLKLAIQKINNLEINPGEVFSYWRQIGNPTAKKGYLPGMILSNGKVKTGVGGGLCQLSNLIFWISLHSPLTVIERWRHSYDVFPDSNRSQPFGSGATCSFPYIDLQIKNNTQASFQLQLELSDDFLLGKLFSNSPKKYDYKVIEKNHCIQHESWGGYSRNNQIYRQIFDPANLNLIDEVLVAENHAIMMYDPLLK